MNQSNIDYLYQVFAPAADRLPSAGRGVSDAAGFGTHLNQASTSVFDVLHPPRPVDTQRNTATTSDSSDTASSLPQSTVADDAPNIAESAPSRNDKNATESSCTGCTSTETNGEESQTGSDDIHNKDREDDAATHNDAAAGTMAASNVQTTQPPVNETKAHKEPDKNIGEAVMKAVGDVAAEAGKASIADKIKSTLPADTPTVATTAEAVPDNSETTEPAATQLEKKPQETADAAKAHSAKHPAIVSEGTAQRLNSETGEVKATSNQAESTLTTEQTAACDDTTKETANAKRRINSAVRNADDDGAASDDKKNTDAIKSSETADGTANTRLASSVAHITTANSVAEDSISAKTGDDDNTATKPVGNKTETALGPLGKSLRSAVEMTRGQKPAGAGDAPQVDPARFVSRVAKAIHTANERGGALQLRLAPPELGALKIELSIKDGVMSAALEADNTSARRLLLDHLPALRERLAEQNIRVERFDVDVRQDDTSRQANSRGSNHNAFQQQADQQNQPRRANAVKNISELATPEPTVIAARITNTAINLVV